MSRSRRHTPIAGWTTAESEKLTKRWWNRFFRRITRNAMQREDEVLPTNIRKETEVLEGPKDGKVRFPPDWPSFGKIMRK